MNFENFKSNYEATFSQQMKGEGSWIELIESEDETVIHEALGNSAEIFTVKRQSGIFWNPPGLKEFKYELVKVKQDRRRSGLNLCQSSCRMCRGASGLWIVQHQFTGRILNPAHPEPFPEMELYVLSAPCPEKLKSSVTYHGWPVTTAFVEIRQFLFLCDALHQHQSTGKLPAKPDFCDIPQVSRDCPGCGNKMRINAIPERLWLVKGLGEVLEEMIQTVVCDSCAEMTSF